MMMSRQETLARLPLPSLEDTLARYLRAATPRSTDLHPTGLLHCANRNSSIV